MDGAQCTNPEVQPQVLRLAALAQDDGSYLMHWKKLPMHY